MSIPVWRLSFAAVALWGCILPAASAAEPFDKASVYIYIDARKATGHPWHGPGDLIIPPPLKHVPTPITRLPEAPGAVLCIVRANEEVSCPGARSGAGTSKGEMAQAQVSDSGLPEAVEEFYKLLQVHDFRGAPTRAYRGSSERLFGGLVLPETFCDPPRCPGDRRFVEETIVRLRSDPGTAPHSAGAQEPGTAFSPPEPGDASIDIRPQSPCPSSYDCEFFDIPLPPEEVFGIVFIDPAMAFTNLIDGIVITRIAIKRGDPRLVHMDDVLRRAAARLAPPGPWEAKRRLRAFSVRHIEDCVAAKCRATQSDFKLEPEELP